MSSLRQSIKRKCRSLVTLLLGKKRWQMPAPTAGKTSGGPQYYLYLSYALVTLLSLMIPVFFLAWLMVFALWILCQIGISIYYFLQYLRHLESVVLTSS